jgi:hypothetical protein
MSTRRFLSLLVFLGIALVPTLALSAEESADKAPPKTADKADATKYTLRYKFQPGETLRWEVVHRSAIRTSVTDSTQVAETVSTSTKAWRVKEVKPDGQATFEHVVESVDMWQQLSGRQPIRYNSKTDKQPPHGFDDVAQSLGKPLSVLTLDSQGKVVKIKRLPVKAAATNSTDSKITISLPTEPVPVGHVWTVPQDVDTSLPNGMNRRVKVAQRLSLEEVKTGVATIKVESQILTPIDDPALESQLLPYLSNGIVRFDIDAGRILSQQIDIDRRIVGFRGPSSSLHYVTRFTEQFQAADTKVAQAPAAEAKK